MTTNTNARRQLIDSLSAQLKDKQSELAKFTMNSKAKRAIELRQEIAVLSDRITKLKAKLAQSTVIDNDTGKVTEKTPVDEAFEAFLRAKDNLLKMMGVPTTRRLIASYIVGLAVACSVGYLLGHIISWMMIGAALLTGSELLVLLVYIIGLIMSVFAGMKAFKAGFEYVANKKVDAHYDLAKATLKLGWARTKTLFVSEPKPVVAS